MQRKDLYIGFPDQQNNVVQQILQDYESRNKSGIFMVASGIRTGKTSVIDKLINQLKIPINKIPFYDATPDVFFQELEYVLLLSGQKHNDIIIATTEISDANTNLLKYLNEFVLKKQKEGRRVTIIGEIVTKQFPAWKFKDSTSHLVNLLSTYLGNEFLVTHTLDADINKIAEGLWQMIEEERSTWAPIVVELGFPEASSDFWENLPKTKHEFITEITRFMNEDSTRGIEGNYGRQKER